MHVSCIILARGGSKGIPNKNLIDFCGKPLLSWTIKQARLCTNITNIWVSSDSSKILDVAEEYGAQCIKRPLEISTDNSTSESAWKHAIQVINKTVNNTIDYIVAPQVTSPIRESKDFTKAINQLVNSEKDSLLSVSEVEDYFSWKVNSFGIPESINYDYKERKPRQLLDKLYLENGSFYIFKPHILHQNNNRLGGDISIYIMDKFKMFQIDNKEDISLCEVIMKGYRLDRP